MGIRKIDYNLCIACGTCVEICPMDVLRLDIDTKMPFIAYLGDCQDCFLCQRDCPADAIYVIPDKERRIPLPW